MGALASLAAALHRTGSGSAPLLGGGAPGRRPGGSAASSRAGSAASSPKAGRRARLELAALRLAVVALSALLLLHGRAPGVPGQRAEGADARRLLERPGGGGALALPAARPSAEAAAAAVRLAAARARGIDTSPGRNATHGRVWLYTLVPADYDGHLVLPHWLAHYRAAGVAPENFLIVVNHNPDKYPAAGLDRVLGILSAAGVAHRVWLGQYSSERHLAHKLAALRDAVRDPEDWVIVADSDEFQHYGRYSIPQFLARAEAAGFTYVRGELWDRLAGDGGMPPVEAAPPLPAQFPLVCAVVGRLYGGKTKKVAAFKAFLRSNQGNHKIVPPEQAPAYFAGSAPGEVSARGGFYGSDDLFPLTPYAYLGLENYRLGSGPPPPGTPPPNAERPPAWDDWAHAAPVTIFHFKWHAAVLRNMRDRLAFYRGAAAEGGQPRYKHYQEAEKVVDALSRGGGRLPLKKFRCRWFSADVRAQALALAEARAKAAAKAAAAAARQQQQQRPAAAAVPQQQPAAAAEQQQQPAEQQPPPQEQVQVQAAELGLEQERPVEEAAAEQQGDGEADEEAEADEGAEEEADEDAEEDEDGDAEEEADAEGDEPRAGAAEDGAEERAA